MSSFSENFRRIRFEKGMTQEEFANLLGTTKQNISRYESGTVSPLISTAEILAEKLGISLSELNGGEDTNAQQRLQTIRETNTLPFALEDWRQLTHGIRELPADKKCAPDYELAALRATEALMRFQVRYAPISPLPMLKGSPDVIVMSYTEMASIIGLKRSSVVEMMGATGKDAITFVKEVNGDLCYVVAYNMTAPFYILQYALACEYGHILLRHDGSKDQDVRAAEVECFANYLLFPRQLLRAGYEAGIPYTVGNVGRATGCYAEGMETVRRTPGVRIPPELNRIVRGQFEEYVKNYARIQAAFFRLDTSPPADLGAYMDNYEE